MRAQYYISFDNVTWTEFYPSNEPQIRWEREPDEIFFRPKIDSFRIARTDNEAVYDTIYGMFFDPTYFATDIYYRVNILGVNKFGFIDPITSGSLDTQNSVFECEPSPNDNYRELLNLYDYKYQDKDTNDIFGHNDGFYYRIKDDGIFTNIDFTTFTDTAGQVVWTNTSGGATQTARNTIGTGAGIGVGQVVSVVITFFDEDPFELQLLTAGLAAASAPITVNGMGIYNLTTTNIATIVQVSADDAAPIGGTFWYEIYYPELILSGGSLYDVLDEVINGASYMNLGLTIVSTILWNDALGTDPPPNIDTYITANPTNDYVREAAAIFNGLWLARTDTFTTEKNTDIKLSLKDITNILKQKLRVWWFIDEDGNFRLEHEKYFRDYEAQADVTTYTEDKPEVDRRKYSYETKGIYNQITYEELNQDNDDWIASPVLFDDTILSAGKKEVNVSLLTTDMGYVLDNPGDATSAGIMLLRTIDMGGVGLVSLDPSPIITTRYYINGYLSWAFLLINYFDYFAEAISGTVNGAAFTFEHVKEFLKQKDVGFHLTTDLDWKKPFTLLEGTGWMDAAIYRPENGMYFIDFGYNPYSIEITVVDSEDISTIITDDGGDDIII